ncbi:glycoside hydrolase family 78 protein [Amnibacterium sp. CER49]|uniref:glycoside hydrolase family 78 protein n=1 Tax=Amnibacterium sp. CER49 TaxID=3039161 RepID=UPI00244C4CE0|nr:glycoside hydrolase family 78 protein [Amnibacterium sp. CER49]MDH2443139.1 glycoside hydrolase family 78 protein [Amnibacterium sp. CER49]
MTARVVALRAEYRADALGLGSARPRLSWRLEGVAPGVDQAAAELELTDDEGRVQRAESPTPDRVLVDWPFAPLVSRQAVAVRIRARLDDGTTTGWSEPLAVEAGLLAPTDWTEPFVSPSPAASRSGVRPGFLLRAAVPLDGEVRRARIRATAHGVFTLALNGEPVADSVLDPAWTSYRSRIRAQTYDVTDRLRRGENVLAAQVADGWYRGHIGFDGGLWDVYGPDVALLAQLEITRPDGRVEVVPLGDRWRSSAGPVTAAGLYEGESFDARLLPAGWDAPGFDDTGWERPALLPSSDFPAVLEPALDPPIRVVGELAPVAVERRPNGRIRLDFGQNIAGRLRVEVEGPRGHAVRLHHAEVLEHDELGTRPLRAATAVDTYVLAGTGRERWAPAFTIHGFRYAELEDWPGGLADGDVVAQVISSDLRPTGGFAASDPLLTRLHENVVWSMRGNFVGLPTDCPNRDERLGWTGDIQIFAPTAAFLFDSAGTLVSWLRDLAAEQRSDGAVPDYVPWLPLGFSHGFESAAWGDAAVVVPWTLYERFGDAGVLGAQWPSMRAWVEHCAALAGPDGLIRTGTQLGDWLDPTAPPDRPAEARTDKYLVANAYLVHSARLVARAAAVLGRPDDEVRFTGLADRTLAAFLAAYRGGNDFGPLGTATGLSLAIGFDLLPDEADRVAAGARLAELAAEGGYRIQTGFVGTPLILDALAATGQIDAAYRLLLERGCPSWLYQVVMGATTTWERWDSMLPDGSINPGGMTSFNHYAFGAVADFLHRRVAGLAPAAPGYRELLVAPQPGPLESASAALETPYGPASVAWRRNGDDFLLDVVVPTGTTATVVLPDAAGTRSVVGAGAHRFATTLSEPAGVPA